jgi:hypothetical protein
VGSEMSCINKVTQEIGCIFCPKYGNGGTLRKVSVTVSESGIVLAARRQRFLLPGTKVRILFIFLFLLFFLHQGFFFVSLVCGEMTKLLLTFNVFLDRGIVLKDIVSCFCLYCSSPYLCLKEEERQLQKNQFYVKTSYHISFCTQSRRKSLQNRLLYYFVYCFG